MSETPSYQALVDEVKHVLIITPKPLSFNDLKKRVEEKVPTIHDNLLVEVLIDLSDEGDIVFKRGRPPRDISWRR